MEEKSPNLEYKIYNTTDNKIILLNKTKNKFLILFNSTLTVNDNIKDLDEMNYSTILNAYGIIGILKIQDVEVLVYISNAVVTGTLFGSNIIGINEVNFHLISVGKVISSEISSTLDGIKNYISGNFYYSENNSIDLTNTFQKIYGKKEDNKKTLYYNDYFWNYSLLKPLFKMNEHSKNVEVLDWTVVAICGFISIKDLTSNDRPLMKMIIISRRNKHNSGTRYNTRGIDSNGYVANYVETEQIMIINDLFFSYVQIRGSVPIIFKQDPALFFRTVQICEDMEITKKPFLMHLEKMLQDYSFVYYIDLLSEKKFESKLTMAFRNHFESLKPNNCDYQFFNFHKECKNDNFSKLNLFIESIENKLNLGSYFYYNISKKEVISFQKHIFRVNCLDCLDRSNVIQYRIGWRNFQIMVSIMIKKVTKLE